MRFQNILPFLTKHRFIIGAFVLGIALAALFFIAPSLKFPTLSMGSYPEVKELEGATWSFQEYSTYFQRLSDEKGAEYAFEVLKQAPFPPGIDLHLLGHVIGDMLYKQKGIDAIKLCTPDFRNACSHTVVIGILLEHGEGSMPQIAETCKQAPGGKGAYTMCFHGLGHGVLAYTGYNLERAVEMCRAAGSEEYQNREYIECVGGTIMEMIGGVHDRTAWEGQVGKYLKKSDPLSPCNAPFMPREVQSICYVHLTPHFFEVAGGNLSKLSPEHFPKAFSYCDQLPKDDQLLRSACYGGFGKEFVVIAQSKDVRNIGSMPPEALRTVRQWCSEAGNEAGERYCDSYALSSLFWGGENNPDASFSFCEIASGELQTACYEQLASHVGYYLGGDEKQKTLCERLPESYRARCMP